MVRSGYLIAGVGLPASGKSTLLRALAEKNHWECYVEPEEYAWASAVDGRHLSGIFTALTWFRSIRVPNLYAADWRRKAGKTVIVDSFYDKLMHYYWGKPGMEWLMPPNDPYHSTIRQMAEIDNHQLPSADLLVVLKVNPESWKRLLDSRKRKTDTEWIYPHAYPFQEHLLNAARLESEATGCRLLVIENDFNSIDIMIQQLHNAVSQIRAV